MSTKRKSHSARFKAKVALEAYKDDKTAAELISAHKISSGQVSTWKKCLVDGAAQLFESGRACNGQVKQDTFLDLFLIELTLKL